MFADALASQDVPLWTIEAALHDGEFRIEEKNESVVRLRLPKEGWLWQKERLLNILLPHVPKQFTKIGWVDCDVIFETDHWADLASSTIDLYPIIQLFEYVRWLGPNFEILPWFEKITRRPSMAALWHHIPEKASKLQIASPGFAWAAQRWLLEKHSLYDREITGGGDTVMALSSLGMFDHVYFTRGSEAMAESALTYGRPLYDDVRGAMGYIPVTLSHLWHGNRKDRQYVERQRFMDSAGFDPRTDIQLDPVSQLWTWSESAKPEVREYMRNYFSVRNEDANPVKS
ncbi:hypothetical protein ACYFX5_26745 [Bremerella sp. T1]|uniref:hypothetical protein n=1 Tax=Bremerella sp. TYQ1 TaxID=3119568 RepID=UPI001CCCD64B|nr:hypothetical protein [Bremerella volcania]UBM36610.1 hypothetical protein LA756_01600 [Bremerella volcania]